MTAESAKAPTKKTKTTKLKPAEAKAKEPKAVEAVSKAKSTEKKSPKNNLKMWNLRLGVVLVAEAVAIVVAGTSKTVELTTQYLAKDDLSSAVAGHQIVATATRHLTDVRLSWIVASFLVIFAATYLLAATLWKKKYEAWLDRGVNKLRWVGLGLGGGIMVAAVAMLSGVSDASTLTLAIGSILLAGLLALAAELLGGGRRLRGLLGVGALLAVFLPWLIFVRNAGAVPMYNASLPMFMYALYACVTLLLVAVGLAAYLQDERRGKWADVFYAERMFIVLGFVGATIVALQIFAGALR